MTAAALDWVLDRSVIGGFTSLGYRLRGLEGADPDPDGRLEGAEVLVTGANSGIGFAAAQAFAGHGARVTMVCRDRERGEDARARIAEQTGSDRLALELCDISDLEAVRDLAGRLDGLDRLDALVHNAGALLPERLRSAQGHEMTFAIHVLGPLLLTRLLTPQLAASDDGRVIFVTSGGMYTTGFDLSDPQLEERDFDGSRFYAHAKRAQVMLTSELDYRLPDPIGVHAMHPGWAATPGVEQSLPRFNSVLGPLLRSPEAGADTVVWLAAAPEATERTGQLWMDRRPRPRHRVPQTHGPAGGDAELLEICDGLIAPYLARANERRAA